MGSDTTLHHAAVRIHYIAIAAQPHHPLGPPVLAHLPNKTTSPTDHDRPARLFFLPLCDSDATTPIPCVHFTSFLFFCLSFCFSISRHLLSRSLLPPVTPPRSPFGHQRVALPRPAQPPSLSLSYTHPCAADTRQRHDSTQRRSDPTSLIPALHVLRARPQTDGLVGSRESSSSFTAAWLLSQWPILVALSLRRLLILPRCSLCD